MPHGKDNWKTTTVFIKNRYKAKETWHGTEGGTFHPLSTPTSATIHKSAPRAATALRCCVAVAQEQRAKSTTRERANEPRL